MRIAVLVIMLLSLSQLPAGCGGGEEKTDSILSSEKMEDVIWDLSRADQLVDMRVIRDSTLNRKRESIRLYEEIFKLHKTSQAQVKSSLAFYKANPVELKIIFDSLTARQQNSMHDLYGGTEPKAVPVPQSAQRPVTDTARYNDSLKRVGDSVRAIYQERYQGKKKRLIKPVSVQ